jgi:O-antigen ligase
MFKNILSGMLPFYPFFYFAEKGLLKASHLTVFLLLMVPVIIILFITNQSTFVYQFDVDESEVVNNISYSFAGLIPFVFLIRKRKFLSVGLIVIITLFIIQGAKRGAIFAGLIGLIMYFYYQMITIEKDNRIQGFLTASIILIGLSGFVYNSMAGNDFVKERMTSMLEGDSSERNIIYTTILDKWYSSDTILKMIFGYGFASSIWIAGIYAHNDWLEMLSNFGLLGIFVYLSLFYAAVRCCLKREWSIDKRILMMTITLIWFFISMVSMAYTDQGFFMQAILLGYITGSNTQNLE